MEWQNLGRMLLEMTITKQLCAWKVLYLINNPMYIKLTLPLLQYKRFTYIAVQTIDREIIKSKDTKSNGY